VNFVVDTNRIIAGLIRDSTVREILLYPRFEFYVPDHLLLEIKNHKEMLLKKSGLSDESFTLIFDLIISNIIVVPKSETNPRIEEATAIIGNIDPDDVPFIALALSVPNDGIWTEDRHFLQQNSVRIWTTKDFIEMMEE